MQAHRHQLELAAKELIRTDKKMFDKFFKRLQIYFLI